MAWLFAFLMIAAVYAVSWLVTCGIIYLITLCFSLEFTWLMATGVWLVILLLKGIFKVTVKK